MQRPARFLHARVDMTAVINPVTTSAHWDIPVRTYRPPRQIRVCVSGYSQVVQPHAHNTNDRRSSVFLEFRVAARLFLSPQKKRGKQNKEREKKTPQRVCAWRELTAEARVLCKNPRPTASCGVENDRRGFLFFLSCVVFVFLCSVAQRERLCGAAAAVRLVSARATRLLTQFRRVLQ